MNDTICGHDRDVLILALGDLAHLDNDMLVRLAQIPEALPEWRNAVLDLVDPVKLAEMLTHEGRRLGFSIERCYVGVDLSIVTSEGGILFRNGKNARYRLEIFASMPQARAILLAWLLLPDGAGSEQALQVLRGNHADPDELINTIPLHKRAEPRRFDPDPDRGE